MPETPDKYRKFQSFAGLRHHDAPPDPLPRIRKFFESLPGEADGDSRTPVIRQAARELLGETPPPEGQAAFRLHDNSAGEIFRLRDEELGRYLFYRFRYETYPERRILDEYPPCVQIEPSSACNFRCVFCYQTNKQLSANSNGHMGKMPLDTFKRVVDDIAGKVEAVSLASRGEPLLCPDIEAMLEYLAGKFLAFKINTNASLLDERKCHAILKVGIGTVVFSADAAKEPEYGRLRVGGSLEKILENVRLFRKIKEQHYADSRMITRVSGVQTENSGDLDEMQAFWGNFVDQVAFVKYNPWEDPYAGKTNDITAPCSDLWRRLFVWWDGRTNPCDVDYLSTLSVGSALETGIKDLWHSAGYKKLRGDHLAGRRGENSPCCRCVVV